MFYLCSAPGQVVLMLSVDQTLRQVPGGHWPALAHFLHRQDETERSAAKLSQFTWMKEKLVVYILLGGNSVCQLMIRYP